MKFRCMHLIFIYGGFLLINLSNREASDGEIASDKIRNRPIKFDDEYLLHRLLKIQISKRRLLNR